MAGGRKPKAGQSGADRSDNGGVVLRASQIRTHVSYILRKNYPTVVREVRYETSTHSRRSLVKKCSTCLAFRDGVGYCLSTCIGATTMEFWARGVSARGRMRYQQKCRHSNIDSSRMVRRPIFADPSQYSLPDTGALGQHWRHRVCLGWCTSQSETAKCHDVGD
jgi:hypothetical protein